MLTFSRWSIGKQDMCCWTFSIARMNCPPDSLEDCAGLQECTGSVLMFNVCLGAQYAYYRMVKVTAVFQKVWCVDRAVYTVLQNLNCTAAVTDCGWCNWHGVCFSNVWRFDFLDFLWVFSDSLWMHMKLQFWCIWRSRGQIHEGIFTIHWYAVFCSQLQMFENIY